MLKQIKKADDMIQDIHYAKTSRDFKRVFKMDLRKFLDMRIVTQREVCFDYAKFEKTMLSKHISTEKEKSLHDIVLENYGQKGVDIIERIL